MAEHCPPAICVEGNALSFPGLRGACRYRRFSGNGRALPSSDLCGGKRSVVSGSAWRGVCVSAVQWQWQSIALQRFVWRETLRRFRIREAR